MKLLWVFAVTTMLDGQPIASEFLMPEQDCRQSMKQVIHDLEAARPPITDTVVSCTPQTQKNPTMQ